jgi:hypothetical protein
MMRVVENLWGRRLWAEKTGPAHPVKEESLEPGVRLEGLVCGQDRIVSLSCGLSKATRSWGWVFDEAVYALSLGQVV